MSTREGGPVPLKLGLVLTPPTLILVYEEQQMLLSKPAKKLRKRTMPIRDLTKTTDCYELASKLRKRHERYLGSVPNVRVEKFLRILQLCMSGSSSVREATIKAELEFTIDPTEDMNALNDRDLKRRKELMDMAFEKNQIKVGDPDFVYDKQVRCRNLHK